MGDGKKKHEVSRRDFLRIFPGMMGKKADEFRKAIPKGLRELSPRERRPPPGPLRLPAPGDVVDGLPLLHPWIGAAQAIAIRHGRARTLPFLLGATGEAFSFFHSLEDPEGAAALSPGNTFLLALALTGLGARSAPGGPFEPALGGVEVAIGKGLTVAIATATGPAVLLGVDREKETARWLRPGEPEADVPFETLREAWREGSWPGGRGAFLRVTVDPGPNRARAEVLAAALPAAASLLERDTAGEYAAGPAAWEALARDVRAGALAEAADVVLRVALPRAAVARRAAGDVLAEIGPIVAEKRRPGVAHASRIFREIHSPSLVGAVYGTGLIPEAAECLLTDEYPDPAKLADPALRERAATLFEEVAMHEREAAAALREE